MDFALLLGTTIMSLAMISTSGCRPRMTAVMSTGTCFFSLDPSSRKMTALLVAAVGFVFWAREIAFQGAFLSLGGTRPLLYIRPRRRKRQEGEYGGQCL